MDLFWHFFKTFSARPFLIAFFFSLLITFLIIPLVKKMGLVDNPSIRRHPANTHKGAIPRAGGLAIYLSLVISIFLLLPLTKQIWGIMIGATIIVIVGLLDDKYDISPYVRFITNIVAALVVVGSGIGVPFITNPLGGVIRLDIWRIVFELGGKHSILVWADLFALLWIVWCMNMVNWSKGVDGQMPGFVTIAAFIIGLLSFRFVSGGDLRQWIPAVLAFITAGAFCGFLPWNFYPQKIMPGYSGGALAGFLLAVLSILSVAKVGTAMLVLGIPMLDAIYTIIRRLSLRKSPFWGDRGHLHHRLLDIGWGRRRIALFYWLVSAILGLVALLVTSKIKLFIVLFIAVTLGGTLLWLSFFSTFSKQSDPDNG